MPSNDDVLAALSTIFDADTGIYRERGFQRRVGFGARPALVHIDLANARVLDYLGEIEPFVSRAASAVSHA